MGIDRRGRLALGLTILTIGGCGKGTDSGGGGGGASIPMSDYIPSLIDNICSGAIACGDAPDRASCVAARSIDLGQLFAAVSAGKTTYDGAAAATCLAASKAAYLTCSISAAASLPSDPSCEKVFNGTLPEGAACTQGDDCLSAACNITSCNGAGCCTGTCAAVVAAPVPIGGDCSAPASSCVTGAFCRRTTSRCVAVIAAGQPCDLAMGDFCAPGFNCVPGGALPNQVCSRPPAEGEPCITSSPCDSLRDYCDPTTAKCALKIAVGGACPSGVGCVEYARCDSASATCVARGKANEACDVSDPTGSCMGSLRCTPAAVCALPSPVPICS